MPLSRPVARRGIHHRIIDMQAYARNDGLYDVEAHLVDTKPFEFVRLGSPQPVPAGQALHDLWIRITVDDDYAVRAVEAASDVTPFDICKEAEKTLSLILGERLVRGWSSKVKERLRGAASCTHLMEMLIPLATTALQGIRGADPKRLEKMGGSDAETMLDSCYAYDRSRKVVKRMWPQHFRQSGRDLQ